MRLSNHRGGSHAAVSSLAAVADGSPCLSCAQQSRQSRSSPGRQRQPCRCLLHDASPHVFVEQRMASGELKEETCELKEARLYLHFFPLTLSRGLSHTPDLLPPGLVDERNLARGISVHLFAHKLQSVWFTRKASSVSRWSNHRLCSVSCCCNAFCCCNATFCCCCADICS